MPRFWNGWIGRLVKDQQDQWQAFLEKVADPTTGERKAVNLLVGVGTVLALIRIVEFVHDAFFLG
jgi:hypothetical protein